MSLTIKQAQAIHTINPNAEFIAQDIDNITWRDGTIPISKEDIIAKASEVWIVFDNDDNRLLMILYNYTLIF